MHAYPDQLADIYSKAAGELVARFREREENVKADVFAAYCDLLRQVRRCSFVAVHGGSGRCYFCWERVCLYCDLLGQVSWCSLVRAAICSSCCVAHSSCRLAAVHSGLTGFTAALATASRRRVDRFLRLIVAAAAEGLLRR